MICQKVPIYENREDVTLTAYLWEVQLSPCSQGCRPAVLICPGGGYMNCSEREAEPVALRFTAMGYQTFVLRYSTYQKGKGGFPDMSVPLPVKEECLYPAQIQEIGKAIHLIQENAKEWNVEKDKIILCGFSAGAHNCALYAANWQNEVVQCEFEGDMQSARPTAVILGYPVSDFRTLREECAEERKFAKQLMNAMYRVLLGEKENNSEALKAISPATQITKNMPPVFLWATSSDELVPVRQSLNLASALAAHKVPFEMYIYEKGSHGLCLADQSTATAQTQILESAAEWIIKAQKWLEKRAVIEFPAFSGYDVAMGLVQDNSQEAVL